MKSDYKQNYLCLVSYKNAAVNVAVKANHTGIQGKCEF